MIEQRVSDQDLSDLRHSNRNDSPVCAFIGRDATAKRVNMNQVCDDLIDCRTRCTALAAEVERLQMQAHDSWQAGYCAKRDTSEADRRALVEAAIKAENERLWDLFMDLMQNWPKRPDGSEYERVDWNGLIDPRWPEYWPGRVLAEFEARK